MRVRRLVATAVASAALLAVTGCSGDETAPVADDPASASAAVPSEEPTESEPSEPEPSDDGAGGGGYDAEELLARMKAAVADNETAHLVMDIGGGGQSMSAEGDVSYVGDTTSMQLTMRSPQLGPGLIEVRMVDGVMYMSMPPMTPKGKFLEFDTTDPNSPFGDLGGVTQGDPLATFEAFDAGLRTARYVGREDVDGEEMSRYVLTVDGEAAAKAQGTPQGALPKDLTYDLWLDDDDLMRRVQYPMTGGGVTISMSEWGEPVRIEAPPRSAIMQLPGR